MDEEHVELRLYWVIKRVSLGLSTWDQHRLVPLRFLLSEEVPISKVSHLFNRLLDLWSDHVLPMVESMVTCIIQLAGFDRTQPRSSSGDTVVIPGCLVHNGLATATERSC